MQNALAPAAVKMIAYCLMPNHYHFILQQLDANGLSQFIAKLCNGYVKAVNLEQQRTGHLFDGKYKLRQIEENEYLLHLSRYIHLNPVRAKLVSQPQHWQFSSCKEYYGDIPIQFIHPEIVLEQFSQNNTYQQFVELYQAEDKYKIEKYIFS